MGSRLTTVVRAAGFAKLKTARVKTAMAAKRKARHDAVTAIQNVAIPGNAEQQLADARQARAKGTLCTEDFIWTVMQCYAADSRKTLRPSTG